ncbi:MAG: hypothetical protein JJE17_08440 [Peptostreptococcaceae bacterium]|nr:hypothetical protein [Peptostreptococcaceae bacterium]
MVGAFFYIDSNQLNYHGWLTSFTTEEEAELYGGKLTGDIGHDKLFDNKFRSVVHEFEYYDFPRGRVVYDTVDKIHIIYTDKCIADKVAEIAALYKIDKYITLGDEHYVCSKCIGDIWE